MIHADTAYCPHCRTVSSCLEESDEYRVTIYDFEVKTFRHSSLGIRQSSFSVILFLTRNF